MRFYYINALSLACIILIVQNSNSSSTVTQISGYSPSSESRNSDTKKTERSLYQNSASTGRIFKSDKKSGNIIFDESLAFSPSSEVKSTGNVRNTRNLLRDGGRELYSLNSAGGSLQNHRLEEPLSPEIVSSAAAAAASSHFVSPANLKLSGGGDSNEGQNGGSIEIKDVGASADASQLGHSRSLVPGQYYSSSNGWASNTGSCLFSCGGFGASSPPCCQLNYVQCCPNPQQEQFNFKNLHHGRGHFTKGIGIAKSGFAWGHPPYNPPPILRPKPCYPFPYNPPPVVPSPGFIAPPLIGGGGSIIHKGFQTLKHGVHNIGQIFKDHVGGGWTSGGNAAAGYYFHRRSDDENLISQRGELSSQYDINTLKKSRSTRSVHKGHEQVGVPCPVYSATPTFGWPNLPIVKPYSVGLGSLIGWSKPGSQIHEPHYGGVFAQGGFSHGFKGYGWGAHNNHDFESTQCKWDYDCPGSLKCCKGICGIPPQHIH